MHWVYYRKYTHRFLVHSIIISALKKDTGDSRVIMSLTKFVMLPILHLD
jgi:hypothetical protein